MFLDNAIGDDRPLSWAVRFWPVLVCALVAGLAATWLCKKVAIRFNIVDRPDETVKTHKEPVAYLGGIGMMVGFVVGVIGGIWLIQGEECFRTCLRWLLGVLAGGAIACFTGVVDDLFDITPKKKLFGQLIASLGLVAAGILPAWESLVSPLGLDFPHWFEVAVAVPIVIVFVLGATNSLNLLDGLDGLCAGVTAIIALAMLLLAVHLGTWEFSETGDPVRMIVCLAILGGILGFLPFNRHPAKIFMGDAGSMLLGFVVAALMIMFAESTARWWLASIVVFGLPILDTATALVRRYLNDRPLMVSDRGHLYDQLMDRGLGLQKTVTLSYVLAAVYAVIGLIMSQIRTRYALAVYVLVFAVSGYVVWKKGFLKMEGLRGAVRKE
ncbi:putative undecaprenyl-phosphate N-acetylglucosaminyl 1-phosphate transferase [Anaerohalosphaera lusitana]|uniref:Putative undecaprenyl-phosphate N-acetylglucosaminyl 1-phosphate transferase n=1 Tax=Anaerohalosphaera lusitana TaxID=1936003 RepID=A0A1U9NQY2_9BACT|nr:MraY family glycosyltransferase [Anaerohalosphaera lusitana]AQT70331.1 putative undecaprenyl-phosphate N-acetylglucosaminyl 1-phosphate transferase [Anaerohalosphaera lusitana]